MRLSASRLVLPSHLSRSRHRRAKCLVHTVHSCLSRYFQLLYRLEIGVSCLEILVPGNVQGPPDGFPYVPGGDLSGVVWELPSENDKGDFEVGDYIAARFTGNGPMGALGEYALVDQSMAIKVPKNLSPNEAAALVSSASYAVGLADFIDETDRVLILGAGGGIGSHLCQLVRNKGASYVVGVSSTPKRLLQPPLSCDEAIDYMKENVLSLERFQQNPFDIMVDLSGGTWQMLEQDAAAGRPHIVKSASNGGRYVTSITDQPVFEVSGMLHFLWKGLHPALWRYMYTRTWARRTLPTYSLFLGTDNVSTLERAMELATGNPSTLSAVLDERGPFPFTTEGVRGAFRLQQSRHVRGKVVIEVSTLDAG